MISAPKPMPSQGSSRASSNGCVVDNDPPRQCAFAAIDRWIAGDHVFIAAALTALNIDMFCLERYLMSLGAPS